MGHTSIKVFVGVVLLFSFLFAAQVKYAGARSSSYGVTPFPTPHEWRNVILNIADRFPGSQPIGVWIVGNIVGGGCSMQFPSPGGTYNRITFSGSDKHEPFLDYFDSIGIKVFLQVESGMADMNDCINVVMGKYKHHPCVVGFGADIEWYATSGGTNETVAATQAIIRQWDSTLKTHKSTYRLFVKHWLPNLCGGGPVSDVVYIDDSCEFPSLSPLVAEFADWAGIFHPNTVMYQVGYPVDRGWWINYTDPIKTIGDAIAAGIPADQEVGIVWVDFSIRESTLDLFREHPVAVLPPSKNAAPCTGALHLSAERLNSTIRCTYDFPGSSDALFSIFNAKGSALFSTRLLQNNGSIEYDCRNNASGMYYLQIRNGHNSVAQKIYILK